MKKKQMNWSELDYSKPWDEQDSYIESQKRYNRYVRYFNYAAYALLGLCAYALISFFSKDITKFVVQLF